MPLPLILLAGTVVLLATACTAEPNPETLLPLPPEDPEGARLETLRGDFHLAGATPESNALYRQIRECGVSNGTLDRGLWRSSFNSLQAASPEGSWESLEDGVLYPEEVYLGLWRESPGMESCENWEGIRQEIYENPESRLSWGLALMLSPDRREEAWQAADRFLSSLESPGRAQPYLLMKRGDIRAMREDYTAAARFYQRAIASEPSLQDYPVLMRLAQVSRLQGREVRARSYEQRAWELSERY